MHRIISRFAPLLLLCHLFADNAAAQQVVPPSLNLGDAVVTGFSGTIAPDPARPRPANKSAIDLTFINPDGPSARIVSLGRPGYVWDGRLFPAPKPFDVLAKDTGQVFGVALDDRPAPNIYLAATSAFGLNLVGRAADGSPERRKLGGPGTGWMKGQFGLDLQGDPGSIYKVDGSTGVVTLFAKVMLDGIPNPGAALGNLAYDPAHQQLLVSDLYTGMIHRFAIADGSEPGPPYDHGVTGRGAANLPPVPFNPANRPNIASNKFNSENPDSWGFAPPERRVFGLAVQAERVFYSTRNGAAAEGSQIWSVRIAQDGSFGTDARLEVEVAAQPGPYPVSDIAFSQKGAMILAQRAQVTASYDYSAFTTPGEPRVLRYWLKDANDPPSPGLWKPMPEEYAVGYAGTYRNTNGGVALGYGYGQDGTLGAASCESALWSTGQNLRNNPVLRSQLEPGGPLVVHGLQGSPADMVRGANEPPATSYFVDYDDKYDDPRANGHMGSVRIFTQPCATAVAGNAGSSPPYVSGPQTPATTPPAATTPTPTPTATPGCLGPNCGPPPIDVKIGKENTPDGGAGTWFNLWVTNVGTPITFPANGITVTDAIPAGMTVTSVVSPNWTCTPPTMTGPGNLTCSYNLAGSLATNADILNSIIVHYTTTGPGPFRNCATVGVSTAVGVDTNPANNTACVTVTKPIPPVDVAIAKRGAKVETPDSGPTRFSYTLAMTNIGPAFAGTNAITVTDVVPAGLTFTSVNGAPNWSCAPATVTTGNTLTCTYIGSGPAAAGASLGSITVNATASGRGPWTNCADVAVAAASGVDSNPANNHSCVTLNKDGYVPHGPPPGLPTACGFNVIFVVDESGSMAPYAYDVTAALSAAAAVFNHAPSQAALIRFSDAATLTYPMAASTYGNLNNNYSPAGETNWQAALQKALLLPPGANTVIVFITDGDPNKYTDSNGVIQYTGNSQVAANAAIPVVNSLYAAGVPIIGFGIGPSVSLANMSALLGSNFQMIPYGGLTGAMTTLAQKLCPGLYLTKSIAANDVNYYNNASPPPVTVTLTLTNTVGTLTGVTVHDDLPIELTNPVIIPPSTGTAVVLPAVANAPPSSAEVSWTIASLPAGTPATLSFTATLSPNPVPTGTSAAAGAHYIYNFAQVWAVGGGGPVANSTPANMANIVSGIVHEPDEAVASVHVYSQAPAPAQYCVASDLWVNKTADNEACEVGGACSFHVTVTAQCSQSNTTGPAIAGFNGPVVFGDGVLPVPGSSTISNNNLSITSSALPPGASMSSCTTNATWSPSSALPSTCNATNVTLPLNETIAFVVTMGSPGAAGPYKNCFLADGKPVHPTSGGFNPIYADVNPPLNGGVWGDCANFNGEIVQHRVQICPSGTTPHGKECVSLPPPPHACPPPLVAGPVPDQCICPEGTALRGKECVRPPACIPPMIQGPVPGQCVCGPETVPMGKRCVPRIECRPPLIPNTAGTDCVCPEGTLRRGKECVKRIVCNPPAQLNSDGACECPRNFVAKGNSCVERERRPPQISPGDIIKNLPGGGRDNPRGGRDNDTPRGGRDNDNPRGGGPAPFEAPGRR